MMYPADLDAVISYLKFKGFPVTDADREWLATFDSVGSAMQAYAVEYDISYDARNEALTAAERNR